MNPKTLKEYRALLENQITEAELQEAACRKDEKRRNEERMWSGFADGLKKAYHLSWTME